MKIIQPCIPSPRDLPTTDSRWRRRLRLTIAFVVGVHLLLVWSRNWCFLVAALFLIAPSSKCLDIFPHPGDGSLSLANPIQNFSYSSDIDWLQGMLDGPAEEIVSDPDSPRFDHQIPDQAQG